MASATLRQIFAAHHPTPTPAPTPALALGHTPVLAPAEDDYAWVYEDPDLAPFRGRLAANARKETPLTAFA